MGELPFSESFLRRLEVLAVLYRRAIASQMQGERRSTKRGQSVEFSDFRPYVPGDDFRRIDWNAFARLERLFIKLFVEEEDLTVHLLIDTSNSMNWGQPSKLEYAIKTASAVGYVALVGLDRVTATALGCEKLSAKNYFPPKRGKKAALSLFTFLQSLSSIIPSENGRSTATWLSSYAASAKQPGPLLIFSDLMNDGWRQGINFIGGRNFEISLLHILAPDEVNPDLRGDFKLIDSENKLGVEITADFETLERYRMRVKAWQESWRVYCRARGMHYLPIETSLPLEELLYAKLPRHGVLR